MNTLPQPVSDFMNALFGSYEGTICFDVDGKWVETFDPVTLVERHDDLRVFPSNKAEVFFIFRLLTTGTGAAFQDCKLKPTCSLYSGEVSILCWAFETPVNPDDPRLIQIMDRFEMTFDEAIPLPSDKWKLDHSDFDAVYTLDQLVEAYLAPESVPAQASKKYGDADIITAYNESDYEGPITVTLGSNRESKNWSPKQMPLAALIGKLCRHVEGNKDGPSVVFADMHKGQRLRNAVKSVTAIGLDIDTGTPTARVDEAIRRLGCCAVRYTTHSHNKISTEFKKDVVIRFDPDAEIDTDLMRRYCAEKQNWDESIVDTVKFEGEDHNEKGIMIRIGHAPMPKHRVFVPLMQPYAIAKEGRTQVEAMAKWAKFPAALADLMQVPFDSSCVDPSRLFYLPRHAKGRKFSISLFGGPLLDRKVLRLDNEFDAMAAEFARKGPKSKTEKGRSLGRWSSKTAHGFQITDVLHDHAPEKLRGRGTGGYNIECPFDDAHSNAGDATDTACFAINAAEGGNELFVIKCLHASCRDYTMLDMLGKMITDGWFDESVINEPDYDIIDHGIPSPRPRQALPSGGVYTDDGALVRDLRPQVSILLGGNKVKLIIEKGDRFEIVSKEDASLWFAKYMLEIKNGNGFKYLPGISVYIVAQERVEFKGLTSDPTVPRRSGDLYTTWRGLKMVPASGDWSLMQKHLRDVVCAGSEKHYCWLMCWMAQMLQQPEKKLGSAVVLRGARGCGKSTVGDALRKIIGSIHSRKVSQESHVVGNFNDHLRDCLFLQVEEAVWGGNKAAEGVLKDLITSDTAMIEAKFVGVVEFDNYTRLMIISNEDWVVPAGQSERRFFVLDVVDRFPGLADDDPARLQYFQPIRDEMENGGLEAMMADLLAWDYSQVNLRQPPMTEGLRNQMAQTFSDEENWLLGALIQGEFTDRLGERIHDSESWELDFPLAIETPHLLASYRDHISTYNRSAAAMQKMLRFLKQHGDLTPKRFTRLDGTRVRGYVLAPLKVWRERFTRDHKYEFESS